MSLAFTSISEAPISVATTRQDANAFMDGVVSTSQAGTLDYDAKAYLTIASATGTVTAYAFGDVDAKATTNALTPVTASVENSFGGIANSTTLSGVSGATASGTLYYDAKARIITSTTQALFDLAIGYSAKANITLDAATADADLTANDFADEDAQASIGLIGVQASVSSNAVTVIALEVIFSNTDFNKHNMANVVRYGNNTVVINKPVEIQTQ